MVQERLSMRKIREILRLRYERLLSYAQIALSVGIGETTVRVCLKRALAAGVSWPLPDDMDDLALETLLYQTRGPHVSQGRELPDFSLIHEELRKKSVTLQLLWTEYREVNPDGLKYSQFCRLYGEFKKSINYAFRNNYRAGEKLFVDYVGKTVPIYNPVDGTTRNAEIFVAVLGASNYTFAEATWSQELSNWISSHQRAFQFFGGTPEIIVPDNLKSGVKRPCRYDPDINPVYYAMAKHYQIAIIPARVRKPKDKAKFEAGVLLVERWILAVLRKRKFFSLDELNEAISELLESLNNRPFKKIKGGRRQLFENIDKPALRPLPERRFEFSHFKLAKVQINYHIEVDGHNYGVPFQYVQKQVEVRFNENVVEIFYKSQRITSHVKSFRKGGYTTNAEHMPPSHQKYVSWTPERMIRWAMETGEFAANVVGS
ncbi:MAG: IS21 family transposase [Oligoflexales bacterium]|nr:IS21 family transposase [Oligoflexales bacterium]